MYLSSVAASQESHCFLEIGSARLRSKATRVAGTRRHLVETNVCRGPLESRSDEPDEEKMIHMLSRPSQGAIWGVIPRLFRFTLVAENVSG